jgi:DNA-binding SARP family transcriptional activator
MRGFLPGHELPWTVEVRQRLERMHARALELLASACLEIGGAELDTAERAARRLIALAPFGESGHRLLIRVLAARGNRAEALRTYSALCDLLREELGASPSPETRRLHRELLT